MFATSKNANEENRLSMFSFIPALISPNAKDRQINRQSDTKQPFTAEQYMADYIMDRNKQAFSGLYRACADDLYHYLLTLSDASLAKDIAQLTWLKVLEKPQAFHSNGSVKAWLFTLARNALIDEFRKTNRLNELDDEYDQQICTQKSGTNVHEEQLMHEFVEDAFDNALSKLPFKQKEAFCLQQEGFSLADIAHMTNSKPETIKTRLRYARDQLSDQLKRSLEHSHE